MVSAIVDLHCLFWYEWVDAMLNILIKNWQDPQNAYLNTAIAYLVILTSGSVVDYYPRCNVPNDAVWVCRMMALLKAKCENFLTIAPTWIGNHYYTCVHFFKPLRQLYSWTLQCLCFIPYRKKQFLKGLLSAF